MHRRSIQFATPSQVHVPVTVDGVDILDNGREVIVSCFTPELADRLAAFINVDAVNNHGGLVGIDALTPSAFVTKPTPITHTEPLTYDLALARTFSTSALLRHAVQHQADGRTRTEFECNRVKHIMVFDNDLFLGFVATAG